MKDELDNKTNELDVSLKKPRGRPGKVVSKDNFYLVLSYFEKKKHLDLKQQVAIKKIRLAAPAELPITAYMQKKIKSYEAYLQELLDRRRNFGSDPFDVHIAKADFILRSDNDIALAEERLISFKKKYLPNVSSELVQSLQLWINTYISQEDWTRCLNLAMQKSTSNRIKKTKMTITTKQFNELLALKNEMGSKTWEEAFTVMMRFTKDALSIKS